METVLITGASSGIGRELAKCFAADGSRLVLVARKRAALQELAEELHSRHKTACEVLQYDLSQPGTGARIVNHFETHGTRIDVLVNNAGFGANGRFAVLPTERQLEMVQVNITTVTELARRLLPRMVERRQGGILNVASTAGFQPGPNMAVYYASKAYVLSLSEALFEEVKGTGVVVSALCPGPTATNFAAVADMRYARLFRRRSMTAEEVARAGHAGFRAGRAVVVPGFANRLLVFLERLAPRALIRKVAGYLNRTK